MDQERQTYIAQLEDAKSVDELYRLVTSLRDLFEVEHAVYHTIQWTGDPFALATYSAEWAKHYEEGQLYLVDPVVLNAFRKFHPYDWKTLPWQNKNAQQLLKEAIDCGVGNQGLSLPIRGPHGEMALLSVSHKATDIEWSSFVQRNRADLMLIGYFIHEAARRILLTLSESDMPTLSPREKDALTLLGLGMNRAGIADHLKISEHTLRVYIESSRMKLGARNTTHAVASALTNGLIAL